MVRVRFFGSLREQIGKPEIECSVDSECSLYDLRQRLVEDGITALDDGRLLCAVNQEIRSEGTVRDGDEVAFFPPVTGG